MQRTDFSEMACSIARSLAVAGEPWSPLVLRDVWVGINRFDDLQRDLGISRKVLAERLKHLVEEGLLERRALLGAPGAVRVRPDTQGLRVRGRADGHGRTGAIAGPPATPARPRSGATGRAASSRRSSCAARHCGEALTSSDVDVEAGPGMTRLGAGEVGVHRGHHDRSFSDGGGDALDRAGADVADGEQPGDRRREGASGRHETLGVELDARVVKPGGPRHARRSSGTARRPPAGRPVAAARLAR